MIGAHCALETCNVNDFLPIRCKCDRLFCKDHISPEMHVCTTLHTEDKPTASTSVHKLQRCAADKCNKPSLEAFVADNFDTAGRTPAVCERCKQSFCATYVPPTYFTINLTQESTDIGLQLHIIVRLQIRTSHLLVMRRRRLYWPKYSLRRALLQLLPLYRLRRNQTPPPILRKLLKYDRWNS